MGNIIASHSRVGDSEWKSKAQQRKRVIFILGPPGPVRTNFCKRYSAEFKMAHISAGDLLRREVQSGSTTGALIQKSMQAGKLVPADFLVRTLKRNIENAKTETVLVEGFPANMENAAVFEKEWGCEPDFTVLLNCSDEVFEQRLLANGETNMEVVMEKLRIFRHETCAVFNYYKAKNYCLASNVDSTQDEDIVFREALPYIQSCSLITAEQVEQGGYTIYAVTHV